MKSLLFDKIFNVVDKLDNAISTNIERYEIRNYNLERLRYDIPKDIHIFKSKFKFNIEVKSKNRFSLDYLIYLEDDKEHIVNINIDFFSGGYFLYFQYNYIYLASKEGVILNNMTNEFMSVLNEE